MRECQQQKMPTDSVENIDYRKQLKQMQNHILCIKAQSYMVRWTNHDLHLCLEKEGQYLFFEGMLSWKIWFEFSGKLNYMSHWMWDT